MADEYTIAGVYVETLLDANADAQLAGVYSESLQTLIEGLFPLFANPGFTPDTFTVQLLPTIPVQSANQGFAGVVYPVAVNLRPFTIKDRERNPYSAQTTENPAEQQRVLREQHNFTQAGDSTFDYGLLLKAHPTRQFTLGSLGRFYHDDYGLILARYCEFSGMVEGSKQGQPVGRLKTSTLVDWKVTNNFSKSGADLVLGLCCIATIPASGSFGWVVTQGANPVSLEADSAAVPPQDAPYSWVTDGTVGLAARGRILGRRWGRAGTSQLFPGAFFTDLEGPSQADIASLVRGDLATELTQITANTSLLVTTGTTLLAVQASLDSLYASDLTITARIALEEKTRARDINSVRELLGGTGFDWGPAIATASTTLRLEYQAADTTLRGLVNASTARSVANSAILASFDITGILVNQTLLTGSLSALQARLTGFTLDLVTVPPADGDILIYDLASDTWIPGPAPSGGGGSGAIYAPMVNGDLPGPTLMATTDGQCIMVEI